MSSDLTALVEAIRQDPEVHTEAEDALHVVGAMLVAGEWGDFLAEASMRTPRGFKWELAAAFLLAAGQAARLANDTHPLSPAQISDRHGFRSALEALGAIDDETGILEADGRRYQEHDWLPCWRELGVELCEQHQLPLQDVTDFDSGDEARGCPRCVREGAPS